MTNHEMVLVKHQDIEATAIATAIATVVQSDRDTNASLFLYSGLVDQIRDTASKFREPGNVVSDTVVKTMTKEYNRLRKDLVGVLFPIVGKETLIRTSRLDVSSTSVDAIYQASAQLSRWCDLVHQLPNFLIAQEIQSATAEKLRSETAQQIAAAPQEPNPKQIGLHPGAYL